MKNWIKKIDFTVVILIIFLAAVFVFSLVPISDGDTGYHLKTGQYIVEHKAVPLYDIFSYTANGARWIAHYWLSDVFFYLVYLVGGLWGLEFFVALISLLTYWILYKTGRLNGISNVALSIAICLFAVIMIGVWSLWIVRPQIFGFLMGAVLLYVLEGWRLSGKVKILLFSIPILFVWANLHASVVLGICLLGLYVGLYIFRNLKSFKLWRIEALIGIAAAAVTLLNPNGFDVLIYSSIISPIVKLVGIFEWRSIIDYLGPFGSPKAPYVFGFMCLAVAVIGWQIFKSAKQSFKSFPWEWAFLAVAGLVLPIISVRHVGYFPVMALFVFAWAVDGVLIKYIEVVNFRNIFLFVLAIIGILFVVVGIKQIYPYPLDQYQIPEGAANFILANQLNEPIFNTISQGSYLIWKLWPGYKVFIDGRSEVYSIDTWKDFNSVADFSVGWKDVFDKYGFETIILSGTVPKPGEKIVGMELLLAYTITQKYNYTLVYWDDASFVIVKNDRENEGIIKKFGYKTIGPYITPQTIPQKSAISAAEEIRRAIEAAPLSQNLKIYWKSFSDYHSLDSQLQ